MAQAFVTTYRNDYRWLSEPVRPSCRPYDKYNESLPDGDIWIVPQVLGEDEGEQGTESILAAKDLVRRMIRDRLWSVYQVHYCKYRKPLKADESSDKSFENALLETCNQVYGPKLAKIPPPLGTARRLYGYIRPTRMYIPNTTYQEDIGRIGYSVLRENLLRTQSKPKSTKKHACK